MKLSDIKLDKVLSEAFRSPTLGGDPEFFIANKHGKIMNADKFLPPKDTPEQVWCTAMLGNDDVYVYFDGIQAEMKFAPSTCRILCAMSINTALAYVASKIGSDYKIVLKPTVKVHRHIINVADPEARVFGCMPDFNAYTLTTNTCEMDASKHPFRYAGGHIHIGVNGFMNDSLLKVEEKLLTERKQLELVKAFDLFVNIPTLTLDNSTASKKRRSKYGKAGCFRPTPYGVEYRSLSCWWIKSPITVSLVYGLAKVAFGVVYKNRLNYIIKSIKTDYDEIRGIIDESDTKSALRLWNKLRLYIGTMFKAHVNPFKLDTMGMYTKKIQSLTLLDYIVHNGIDTLISNKVLDEWLSMEFLKFNSSYDLLNKKSFYHGLCTKLMSKSINILGYQKSLINQIA